LDAVADTAVPRRVVVHLGSDQDRRALTVRVSDSGPGISSETAARVFQDGYTTKPPRAGLQRGLGLALVHRLVTQRGGRVEIRTGPGATFEVTLPLPSSAADHPFDVGAVP
jgi:two-component system CitB family sensor kinase